MIPHFEKMLYDNGPLLALYSQAHAATGEALFARTAQATAEWVMREMQSPEGASGEHQMQVRAVSPGWEMQVQTVSPGWEMQVRVVSPEIT